MGIIMMDHVCPLNENHIATVYKVIPENCVVSPLWQQYEEDPHISLLLLTDFHLFCLSV